MSTITISDLHPVGAELFSDSETFMADLTDSELSEASGGGIFQAITSRALGALALKAAPAASLISSAIATGVVAYTILRD